MSCGAGNHPARGESLDGGGGIDANDPSHRHAALSNDDLLAVSHPVEPVSETLPQLCRCNIHSPSVQPKELNLYGIARRRSGRNGCSQVPEVRQGQGQDPFAKPRGVRAGVEHYA